MHNKQQKNQHQQQQQQQQQQHGEVLLQICYDCRAKILYVTVIRAKNLLTLREDGDTRPDPFIKIYLLPGRR